MRTKRFHIGIMVANQRQGRQALQSYLPYKPRDANLYAFQPSSINSDRKGVWGLERRGTTFRSRRFPLPDVVYNRFYGFKVLPELEEAWGPIPIFNQVNHFNKQSIDGLLRTSGLSDYLPETAHYEPQRLIDMLSKYGTVFLKPVLGNKGHLLYRVGKTSTGEVHLFQHYTAPFTILTDMSLLDGEFRKLANPDLYLIQQGIPFLSLNGREFDVRVLVQKDRTGHWGITNMISRIARLGCFNTSVCDKVEFSDLTLCRMFPKAEADRYIRTLEHLGLLAAAVIEQQGGIRLGELSVDFGIDVDGKIWIVEINGQPQKTLYKELNVLSYVCRKPMEYSQFLIQNSKS